MLQVMQQKLKPGGHDFAKTHPSPEARIAELEQAGSLPKGIERKAVEDAKSAYEIVTKAWANTTAAHDAGDIEKAVGGARACDLLITRVMESLGVAQPAAEPPVS